MIFYLLLLSLAERIGFNWGFLFAGGATVLLLSANTKWMFRSLLQGFRALAVFSLLYLFIYLLLRLEDTRCSSARWPASLRLRRSCTLPAISIGTVPWSPGRSRPVRLLRGSLNHPARLKYL